MIANKQKRKSLYWVTIVLVSILLIEGSSLCFAQNVVWTVTHNPSGSDEHATAICADGTYIYIAGYDWSPGHLQWRIQKRNKSDGSVVWTVTENPSTSNDNLLSITCDDSYIYLGGYDSSPGYEQWRIQKRNKSDGSIVWTKTDIPVVSIVYAITCDDTYIYAVGLDRSPGDGQWRIEKRYKSDGSVVWTKHFNPSSDDEGAYHITSDNDYIYITGGYYVGFANDQCIIQKRNKSDGFIVWEVTENPSDYYDSCGDIVCDDTYLYTAGHDSSNGGRWDDQWRIQKWYKSDGSLVWTMTEDLSSSYDTPYAITSDDNYIYVCGRDSSPGYFNFQWRIQKRNKLDGSVVWTETENPGSGEDYPFAITSDSTYIYLAGCDSSQGDEQWRIQKREAEPPCQVVYQTDFSSDPCWITNNASRYCWNASDETYDINQININYSGEYAYYDTGYGGASFRLEWDINMLVSSYATGIPLGLFDTGLYCHHLGNHAWVSFVRGDRGQEINLGWLDLGGVEGHMWSTWHYSLDTWYHVVLEYDGSASTLTATVTLRETGEQLCSLAASNVGPFATDMDRVGTSGLRDGPFQVPGAESRAKIDNVTLCLPDIEVDIDIKPGSCPNPLNVKSKGVLTAAILGSEDFDVNTIDIASVRLEGVAPIRSSSEDVAAPVLDGNECDCTIIGPDGFVDLVLKFETEQIVEAIGDVNEGDVLPLVLEGVLSDGGIMIQGTDCVVIRGRHRSLRGADINKDGVVDHRDFAVFAARWLQRALPDE